MRRNTDVRRILGLSFLLISLPVCQMEGQTLQGRRVPVVGTVCMDNTMIDVTDLPDVEVGDEAVLIGRQGNEEILPDDIAANGGTINYEIACKISPRVTRIFVQS